MDPRQLKSTSIQRTKTVFGTTILFLLVVCFKSFHHVYPVYFLQHIYPSSKRYYAAEGVPVTY